MVILLAIITFGIYLIYWQYRSFQEVHEYRGGRGWSGVAYLIFSLVPVINIVGIVIPWLLPAYVGRMYEENGLSKPLTGWSGCWVLLPFLGVFIWIFVLSNALNQFWIMQEAEQRRL